MTKTIYIAGPMTGIEDHNFPAFFRAEHGLRRDGWFTINPAQHDLDSGYVNSRGGHYLITDRFDLNKVLLWDLQQVAHADAIYLLRGWEASKGANAERALAVALGKDLIFEEGENLGGTTPVVIGLGGRLASGKDAVADHLVATHGFIKLGMSDPLVDALLALDPIVWPDGGTSGTIRPRRASDVIDDWGYAEAKKQYPEMRRLLQNLGTEVGRKMIGENVWVDIAVRRINALVAEGKSVVITGVRFPNEVTMFQRVVGAETITGWVNRPDHAPVSAAVAGHASETSVGLADFDVEIQNEGTLGDLYDMADHVLGLQERIAA